MRKRMKALWVLLCMFVFATMALGSTSSDSEDVKEIVTETGKESTDTNEETKNGETVTDENKSGDGENKNDKKGVTIEEQLLFDKEGIVVTAKEYVLNDIWGEGIKLLIENNSNKSVTVGCNALIVNDYMITDLFVSEIAPGKKANETMYLSDAQLKAAGIDCVGQVEIYFHVYDSNSYDTVFDTDCITIKTSNYETMDTTSEIVGAQVYDEGGIRIIGKAVDEDSFWGSAIVLYCENNSGKNVGITVEEMSINGFMMDPIYSSTVYDGKKSIDDITLFSSDLEENDIESIDEVELKFHIYDKDTYMTIADSDVVSFSTK